jgi:large subunit ribosomal protein L9
MKVILLERIETRGQIGDVVNVKNGYARNFLLPKKKALRSTPANKELFEGQRVQLEAQNLERKKDAEGVSGKLDNQTYVILRQAGEAGKLYGSVSNRDIAELISAGGITVERQQVILDNPLKSVGMHSVRISLHPEVSVKVNLNIARTKEESERQARGESATGEATTQEESTIAAEEVFETEDLAKAAEAEFASDDDVKTTDEVEKTEDTETSGDGDAVLTSGDDDSKD